MMKKLAMLLVLLLLAAIPAWAETTAAESWTISLDQAEISFTAPADTIAFTTETSASVFNQWGMSQREMFAYMEEYGIIAVIYDLESDAMFEIGAYPWDVTDYDAAGEKEIERICRETQEGMREEGYEVTSCEFYRNTGHGFVMADMLYVHEDGYEEPMLLMITDQHGHEVYIYAYPEDGEGTDAVKQKTLELADSVVITPKVLDVTTQELPDGDFSLTVKDRQLTFTPMDSRYVFTRLSDAEAFENMGYQRDEELAFMEENHVYAMLYDQTMRACVQVHLLEQMDAVDYDEIPDETLIEAEKSEYAVYGWAVDSIEVISVDGWKFVKTAITAEDESGLPDRRVVYTTCFDGVRVEIQAYVRVYGFQKKVMQAVEPQIDEFVQGIRVTQTEALSDPE